MHWLPVATLMSFGFAQLFKWAQRVGCHGPTVVMANYLVMSISLATYLAWRGEGILPVAGIGIGALTGVCFVSSLLVLTYALTVANVGGVLTAFRLSILMPIALGVWLWDETLAPFQVFGIGVGIAGLGLMTWKSGAAATSPAGNNGAAGGSRSIGSLKSAGLLFLVFFSQGWSHVGMASVHHEGLDGEFVQVLFVISLTACSLGALSLVCLRRKPKLRELKMGAFIGLYNGPNLIAILLTLSAIPSALYFPLQGAGIVVLDNLCAHFFWKERLNKAGVAGAALGVLSILLVYLPAK